MVGATTLLQHTDVPALEVARARATKHILQLLGVEEAQTAGGEDRVESWKIIITKFKIPNNKRIYLTKKTTFAERLVLLLDSLDKEPVRYQRYVLMQVVDRHWDVTTTTTQFDVGVSGQYKVQSKIGNRTAIQVKRFNLKINKYNVFVLK